MRGSNVTQHNGRRALDRWARDNGWADMDTYTAMGQSILACKVDLLARREEIDQALLALGIMPPAPPLPVTGEAALQHAEAEQTGELPDVSDYDPPAESNAHVQGADS